MNNFLNKNDIFPILELIKREVRKNDFEQGRVYIGIDEAPVGDPTDVASVDILRGGSTYDPDMINSVVVTYVGGAVEMITLMRGANPPVPNSVPDYEFINNVLITGVQIAVTSLAGNRNIQVEIVREGGYGRIQRMNMHYVE